MLGTFLKDFSQVATFQEYFPKLKIPKCAIFQETTKSFLAAVVGPPGCSSRGARPSSPSYPQRSTLIDCLT